MDSPRYQRGVLGSPSKNESITSISLSGNNSFTLHSTLYLSSRISLSVFPAIGWLMNNFIYAPSYSKNTQSSANISVCDGAQGTIFFFASRLSVCKLDESIQTKGFVVASVSHK